MEISLEEKEAIEDFKREYNDGRILKSDIIIELDTARIVIALIDKLQKEIDLILKFMLEEVICEADLDNIYAEMNNCNGIERSITRGDKEELKMLKEYFYKKAEE